MFGIIERNLSGYDMDVLHAARLIQVSSIDNWLTVPSYNQMLSENIDAHVLSHLSNIYRPFNLLENDNLFGSLNHALLMSLISIPTELEPSRLGLNTLIVNSSNEYAAWKHVVSISRLRNSVVWNHGIGKYHQSLLHIKNSEKFYKNAAHCKFD